MNRGPSDSGYHFLMDYLTCQKYFYWKYVKMLTPSWTSPALIFGRAIHEGLAYWYQHLALPTVERTAGMIHTFIAEMEDAKEEYLYEESYINDKDRGIKLLDAYAVTYPYEPIQVLEVEKLYEHSLPTGDKFTGRIDLATEINNQTYIVDHKTTGWSIDSLSRTLQVSNQVAGYMLLWNKHHEKPASGVLFNILYQKKSVIRFSRLYVYKTDRDLESFLKDATAILQEIREKLSTESRWVRDTNSCFNFNKPCPYLTLCQGANYEGLIGTKYKIREDK